MQVYNKNWPEAVSAYFSNSTEEQIVQTVMDVYFAKVSTSNWNQYHVGWERRVTAQTRVFKRGIYLKDY